MVVSNSGNNKFKLVPKGDLEHSKWVFSFVLVTFLFDCIQALSKLLSWVDQEHNRQASDNEFSKLAMSNWKQLCLRFRDQKITKAPFWTTIWRVQRPLSRKFNWAALRSSSLLPTQHSMHTSTGGTEWEIIWIGPDLCSSLTIIEVCTTRAKAQPTNLEVT